MESESKITATKSKQDSCPSEEENVELACNIAIPRRGPKRGDFGRMPFSNAGLANAEEKPEVPRPNEPVQKKAPKPSLIACTWKQAAASSISNESGHSPLILSDSGFAEASSTVSSPSMPSKHHVFFEFEKEILAFYRTHERKHLLSIRFMSAQKDVTVKIRAGIINWLVELTENYEMQTETLHLAASYVDRMFSIRPIKCPELLAIAALLIAAKYEEVHFPGVDKFVEMAHNLYSKKQVLATEMTILSTLNFDMSTTTSHAFLNLYATKLNFPDILKFFAMFLCDMMLLTDKPILPSVTSAAAIALARYNLKQPIWTKELKEATQYSLKDLQRALLWLTFVHCMSPKLEEQHVQLKYETSKYMQVSTIKPVQLKDTELDAFIKQFEY